MRGCAFFPEGFYFISEVGADGFFRGGFDFLVCNLRQIIYFFVVGIFFKVNIYIYGRAKFIFRYISAGVLTFWEQ